MESAVFELLEGDGFRGRETEIRRTSSNGG